MWFLEIAADTIRGVRMFFCIDGGGGVLAVVAATHRRQHGMSKNCREMADILGV